MVICVSVLIVSYANPAGAAGTKERILASRSYLFLGYKEFYDLIKEILLIYLIAIGASEYLFKIFCLNKFSSKYLLCSIFNVCLRAYSVVSRMFCYLAIKTHLYALVNSKYFHLEPFWNHLICKAAANKRVYDSS